MAPRGGRPKSAIQKSIARAVVETCLPPSVFEAMEVDMYLDVLDALMVKLEREARRGF